MDSPAPVSPPRPPSDPAELIAWSATPAGIAYFAALNRSLIERVPDGGPQDRAVRVEMPGVPVMAATTEPFTQ